MFYKRKIKLKGHLEEGFNFLLCSKSPFHTVSKSMNLKKLQPLINAFSEEKKHHFCCGSPCRCALQWLVHCTAPQ